MWFGESKDKQHAGADRSSQEQSSYSLETIIALQRLLEDGLLEEDGLSEKSGGFSENPSGSDIAPLPKDRPARVSSSSRDDREREADGLASRAVRLIRWFRPRSSKKAARQSL